MKVRESSGGMKNRAEIPDQSFGTLRMCLCRLEGVESSREMRENYLYWELESSTACITLEANEHWVSLQYTFSDASSSQNSSLKFRPRRPCPILGLV